MTNWVLEQFEERYRPAIRAICDKHQKSDHSRLTELVGNLYYECLECEEYLRISKDKLTFEQTYRERYSEARRELRSQISALKKVENFARKNSSDATCAAIFAGIFDFTDKEGKVKGTFAERIAEYSSNLEMLFNRSKTPFLQGQLAHNLLYPSGVPRKTPEVSTGLLISLTSMFRKFSCGQSTIIQIGEPMPKFGTPNYRLAADLAEIATGAEISDPQGRVRHYLEKNPDVKLWHWGGGS